MALRKPKNAHEWIMIFQSHKKKFFFSATIVMIGVVIGSWWIPREYRAQAIVERENDSALQQMGSSTIDQNVNQVRMLLSQQMKGRAAVEQLIEDLQLTQDLPHGEDGELTPQGKMAKEDLVQEFQDRIGVYSAIHTETLDQIIVAFTHPDRELAPKVVNRVVDNYIRKTRQQLDEMLVASKGFFEKQVSHYEMQIRKLETDSLNLELEHPGLLPNDPASVEVKLKDMRSQLARVTEELQLTKEKRAALEEWIKNQPEFIEKSRTGQNPEALTLYQKKNALETELENHLYNLGRTEEHPAVKRVRERIIDLEKQIKETEDQVVVGKDIEPNTNRMQAESQLAEMNGTIVALERQKDELAKDVDDKETFKRNFFVIRNKYQKILRELAEARLQFTFWDENKRRTNVALAAEIGQRGVRLRIAESAPELARPSSPTISKILVLGLGLGGAVGAALVFLAELLDSSFRSIEQAVEELKLPVFGAVNEIVSSGDIFRRKVMAWGVYPVLAIVLLFALGINLFMVHKSLNDPAGYESLKSNPRQYLEQSLFGR